MRLGKRPYFIFLAQAEQNDPRLRWWSAVSVVISSIEFHILARTTRWARVLFTTVLVYTVLQLSITMLQSAVLV